MNPRCEIFIVMGKTDPSAERHRQQSQILVPRDTPGVEVKRGMRVFGYDDGWHGGHAEVVFTDVRVPAENVIAGEGEGFAIAQARLAHVLQWRGDFADADQLFAEANSTELPDRLRATMHEHAGKSCYDQGRYIEACNHFEKALELRKVEDPELMARTELALDAVFRKVAENGWGPYPRTRDEILRVHKPPVPQFDDKKQCWGYVDPSGTTGISPAFADDPYPDYRRMRDHQLPGRTER